MRRDRNARSRCRAGRRGPSSIVAPPARIRKASATTGAVVRVRVRGARRPRGCSPAARSGHGRHPASNGASLGLRRPLRRGPALVLAHGAEHRPRKPLAGRAVRDLAHVHGEHLAARPLDAGDELVLHPQRAHQPVEVGGDDHLGLAGLDGLDGPPQARAPLERGAAGHVQFLDRLQQASALRSHSASIRSRCSLGRCERLALAALCLRDADDADSPARCGGGGHARVPPVVGCRGPLYCVYSPVRAPAPAPTPSAGGADSGGGGAPDGGDFAFGSQ